MAAAYLKGHVNISNYEGLGIRHLERAYQEFFCIPGSAHTPRHNDFSDQRAYHVEKAIAKALSTGRDLQGKCPRHARHLLLDMLNFNENGDNEFSDDFKIANLLDCLTNSLIPSKIDGLMDLDDEEDSEFEEFKNNVLGCLDRYVRRDVWMHSYQNIITVTAMRCKERLMKAKIIPVDAPEFAQYLHDGNSDAIRVQGFKSLVNLGFLRHKSVATLLLNSLSTDRSPYTRDRLFDLLCLGMADMAFGEALAAASASNLPALPSLSAPAAIPGEGGVLDGEGEPDQDLKILDPAAVIAARTAFEARTKTMVGTLVALKDECKDLHELKAALWTAIGSPIIGFQEQANLLDFGHTICDAKYSMTVKLRMPRYWKVKHLGKVCILYFSSTRILY